MYFRYHFFYVTILQTKAIRENAENPGDNLQIRGSLKMDQDKWQSLLFVITHNRKLIILFFLFKPYAF